MSQLLAALKAQPDVPLVSDDAGEINRRYRYWRWRILSTSLTGYAIFYFVRTNISNALPFMSSDLGYSKSKLGILLTVGGLTYGVSKLVNGFLGDRANPRFFMPIGLLLCALMNVFFGLSSALVFLAVFWFLNNWAQGMGFPPCARNMGYWFSPRERGTSFGIWHTGHTAGAALVSVLTGFILKHTGDWRLCFFIPAGIAVAGAVLLLLRLRDTPGSLGLPPVEVYRGEESPHDVAAETRANEPYLRVAIEFVFKNPFMWVISVANLLVYTLRYATLHWGPTYLYELKGMSTVSRAVLHSGGEVAGLVSALAAGYAADRYFRGRAGRVCVLAMAAMAAAVYLFWVTPPSRPWLLATLYLVMGFMVYIPQMLIAAMAMNLATKRAAAVAVGLTGIFGYASSLLSGWGVGLIVDKGGWDGAFILMIGCALATLVLMAFTWNVGAHPHLPAGPLASEASPAAPLQPAVPMK